MKRFFLVFNPARNMPKVQHNSLTDAYQEARRLAEKQPNEDFVVLEAVHHIRGSVNVELVPFDQPSFKTE